MKKIFIGLVTVSTLISCSEKTFAIDENDLSSSSEMLSSSSVIEVSSSSLNTESSSSSLTNEFSSSTSSSSEISSSSETSLSSSSNIEHSSSSSDVVGCAPLNSKGETKSVLFLGNSLLNGVASKVETLLECGGYMANVGVNNPGGYKLYQHNSNSTTNSLIAQGYDQVYMHEQSAGIHNHHSEPYATIDSLKQKVEDNGGEAFLYQTWGYAGYVPDYHIAGYEAAGSYLNMGVAAVGRAWKKFTEDHGGTLNNEGDLPFSLFSDDRHASTHGQVLIAFVFYAYITGESPVNLDSLNLSDVDAKLLQEIAWSTYQNYSL